MTTQARSVDIYSATLSRRRFIQGSGALVVGFALVGKGGWLDGLHASTGTNSPDATRWTSWFEIREDNTIVIYTGKADFGQSTTYTAFRQIAAEELHTTFEAITEVVLGDTDRTPDGGISAGYLRGGTPNVRKVAAYTYQALLELAAVKLGVSKNGLSVENGIVSGGGKSISYGQLVKGAELKLTIPVQGTLTHQGGLTVLGDPPMTPVSEYKVIGKSYLNPATATKVAAKATWVSDVRLPGMLHARVIHPKTLGSTIISAGAVDKTRYPNARVVVKGNLVAVVAPTEWEAIGAARQVATGTKWTEWTGLPGNEKLFEWLRKEADWKTTPVQSGGTEAAVKPDVANRLSVAYELPYMKHAPIGPAIAVADARAEGTVYAYSNNQNPSMLRGSIAKMLGTSIDNVIVRSFPGSGHYGRSNGGHGGAEDEAVILSKAVGAPVRVQWMRPEDIQWSTNGTAAYSDIEIGIDANGKLSTYQADHYMPAFHDDRPVGALIAGLPTISAPNVEAPPENFPVVGTTANRRWDPWVYDRTPEVLERCHGTFQVGERESPLAVGLRNHSMRTPGQYSQNCTREMAISEAAALAGVDPLQFRLDSTDDVRMRRVLTAVRDASGWQDRPARGRGSAPSNAGQLRGWGVSAMKRGAYWACVCEVSIDRSTGQVRVERCVVGVEPGIIINPLQLKRQVQGGALMGVSHALHEEVLFDQSAITNRDWRTYPILTMAEAPYVEVVLVNDSEARNFLGASEAANALPPPAIAAAVSDATGRPPRRLPLKPTYVQELLRS